MTEAIIWKKRVLPGYTLMRAQVDFDVMKKGMYGLVRCDDPDVIWDVEPVIDPLADISDKDVDALDRLSDLWSAHELYNERALEFAEWFRLDYERIGSKYKNWGMHPDVAYDIIDACKQVGYDREKHGYVEFWLLNHIARFIRDNHDVSDVGKINRGEEKDEDDN
jgi:hypothetical protein